MTALIERIRSQSIGDAVGEPARRLPRGACDVEWTPVYAAGGMFWLSRNTLSGS